MTQQTPFTQLPKPKHTQEYVVILKEIDSEETGLCTSLVGNGLCRLLASWQCVICNQWTCDLHAHPGKQFVSPDASDQATAYSMCENCGMLAKVDQEMIYRFQTEMNAL